MRIAGPLLAIVLAVNRPAMRIAPHTWYQRLPGVAETKMQTAQFY
jgi:hypothetical protein